MSWRPRSGDTIGRLPLARVSTAELILGMEAGNGRCSHAGTNAIHP